MHARAPLAGLPPPRGAKMKPVKGDPFFREVWRKFQLRVHPDLFSQFPELQAVNAASLQKLQGVLNEAKTAERAVEDALKPRTESLEFYLSTPAAPGAGTTFVRVPVTLRIPGANCQHVVAETMARLFKHAGLPQRFFWGPEFWGSTYTASAGADERRDMEEEEGDDSVYGEFKRKQREHARREARREAEDS
jgi:Domain of unknown function (DUF4460)